MIDPIPLDCPIRAETVWPRMDDERMAQFLGHWARARQGAVVARRSAIDPGAIIPCLPYVWIYRFDRNSGEFTCTLAGNEVNMAWRGSIVGKRQQDFMPPGIAATLHARFRAIVATPAILCTGLRGVPALIGPTPIGLGKVRRLVVPLVHDDGGPYGVFGISIYTNDPLGQIGAPVAPAVDAVMYDCRVLPTEPP